MRNFFEFVQPHPALREYVRLYHVFRLAMPAGDDGATMKTVWPSRYSWLSFSPLDNSRIATPGRADLDAEPRAALIGHSTRVAFKRYVGPCWYRFQVQFQPGALYRLTGLPQSALTDAAVDADAVLPRGTATVNDRLAETDDIDAMTAIVDPFLHRWIDRCTRSRRPIDRAIERLAHDDSPSLAAASSIACLSARQFHRSFVERMGTSPGTYLRVVRLARAFNLRAGASERTWADIAQASGYYDYQHMARDFRLLTGERPERAFDCERRSPESRYQFSFERGW